jgi:hypothetical protein
MFPSADTVEDAPPKQEQTVMRQAAELLEEALREAGGSMDEIGTNPLFSAGGDRARSNERPSANRAKAAENSAEPIQQAVVSSKPPRMYPPGASTSAKEPSSPKVVLEQEPTSPGMRQALRARVARSSAVQPGKKKGPMLLVAVAAVAAVAVAILMFGKSFFGETTFDAPRASPSDQAEPSTPPALPPVPMVAAPVPVSEDAHAAASPAGSVSRPAGSAVVTGAASASTVQAMPPPAAVANAAPKPVAAAPPAPARPQPPPSPPAAPAQPAKPRGAAPAPSAETDNPY